MMSGSHHLEESKFQRISTRSPICILGMNENNDKMMMMREKFENMEFPKA
jgi:hypothetical protein